MVHLYLKRIAKRQSYVRIGTTRTCGPCTHWRRTSSIVDDLKDLSLNTETSLMDDGDVMTTDYLQSLNRNDMLEAMTGLACIYHNADAPNERQILSDLVTEGKDCIRVGA